MTQARISIFAHNVYLGALYRGKGQLTLTFKVIYVKLYINISGMAWSIDTRRKVFWSMGYREELEYMQIIQSINQSISSLFIQVIEQYMNIRHNYRKSNTISHQMDRLQKSYAYLAAASKVRYIYTFVQIILIMKNDTCYRWSKMSWCWWEQRSQNSVSGSDVRCIAVLSDSEIYKANNKIKVCTQTQTQTEGLTHIKFPYQYKKYWVLID